MRVFVWLRVMSMVSAVGVAYAPSLLMRRAAATRDVSTIRAVFVTSRPLGPVIPILFFTGLGFAILAIITEGFNPLQPWLLIAYVLFAIGVATGILVSGPYIQRVADMAATAPEGPPSPELTKVLDDPIPRTVFYVELVVVALILFDMIMKPFS